MSTTMDEKSRVETLLSQSRSFFVIDKNGILQHFENFDEEEMDADLFAGLFSAVSTYAKELNAGDIQRATLEDHKFIFAEAENTPFLIVLDVDTEMSDENGSWLVNRIVNRFAEIQALKKDDVKGKLSIESLFSERGKTINWNTIHAIRQSAIQSDRVMYDHIETLNLTKINIRNKIWVKYRRMIQSLVENQSTVAGVLLILRHMNALNKLYSGRGGLDRLSDVHKYMEKQFKENTVGYELETQLIQIGELYVAIFPIFNPEGGLFALASKNSATITRLTTQVERLVSSIEKILGEGL